MEKMMSIREFGEDVCQYVKAGLPSELEAAEVFTARLDMGDGDTHIALLVIRPWNKETTGFYLDGWYIRYISGDITVESAAADIINDRRLYNAAIE
jgi:hypothetical protein